MQDKRGELCVSKATIYRLPAYLRYLKMQAGQGVEYVSSATLAEEMSLSAVAVRKDLALMSSVPGKPRSGFFIKTLISDLEQYMGYYQRTNAVVVGAGKLGKAILGYDGFEQYGFHLTCAFDVSPTSIGAVGGKPVYPMARLSEIVRRERVTVGILTVPPQVAQSACEQMIGAGINSILCFAPTYLHVPEGVIVKYVDLAASLASLCGGQSE